MGTDSYSRPVPHRILTGSAEGATPNDQNLADLPDGSLLKLTKVGGIVTLQPASSGDVPPVTLPADPTIAPGYAARPGTLGTWNGVTYACQDNGLSWKKLTDDWVTLYPLGDGSDDWPQFTLAMELGHKRIRFAPGLTFICKSAIGALPASVYGLAGADVPLGIPDGVVIDTTGATINAQFSDVVTQSNSCFYSIPLTGAATTTLTAQGVIGSNKVTVSSLTLGQEAITQGCTISISVPAYNQGRGQFFTVRSIAGTELTLDRPLKTTWAIGSIVGIVYRRPKKIFVLGTGTVTGTAHRLVELSGCLDSEVWDLTLRPTTVHGFVASFDNCGLRCAFRRVRVEYPTNADGDCQGLGVESGEDFVFEDCYSSVPVGNAYRVIDSVHTTVRNCSGANSARGIYLTGYTALGSSDTLIDKCDLSACTAAGVSGVVDNSGTRITSTIARGCYVGFLLVEGAKLIGCKAQNCTTGYRVDAAGSELYCCEGHGNVAYDFYGSYGCRLIECTTDGGLDRSVDFQGMVANQVLIISGGKYETAAQTDGMYLISFGGTTNRVVLSGVRMVMNGSTVIAAAVIWLGALASVTLRDCRLTINGSNANSYGVYAGGATCVYEHGNNDFSAAATPRWAGTAKWNRGTIALSGATPVTYAFPDIKAGDTMTVTRQTIGGTPAHFTAAISAGVGVVLTGTAGDTSVVACAINP